VNFKIELQKILKNHYDLIFGFLFFFSYRIFFTWLLWHGRTVPPEPDDSYYYLARAKHIFNVNSFEDFRLLPFSLWLNFLSVFVHSNLEIAYKINFYIGPVAMFAALYHFISKLENSRRIRLLLLMVIALYSGSGDYHGFYWVVGSYYQLALFFIILAFLIGKQKTNLYRIFPICFLFIFIHPTSAFLSSIFIFYPIMFSLFSKKEAKFAFKKLSPMLICLAISIFLYILIGRMFPDGNSSESFQTQAGLIKDFFLGKLNPISFPIIWREYFTIFFNNIVTTITYFVMLALLFYLKKYKLLAIFFSILIIVLLSSFIPYGSRTLGIFWPITFFVIGYFLVSIWKILQSINTKIKLGFLTVIPLVGIFALATIFNIIFISSLNTTKNYDWDRSCPLKLQDDNLYFTSLESMNAFSTYNGNGKNLHFLSLDEVNKFSMIGNVIVETKKEQIQPPTLFGVKNFLASKITRRNRPTYVEYPINAFTTPPADSGSMLSNLNQSNLIISRYLDCGHFQVSVVKKL